MTKRLVFCLLTLLIVAGLSLASTKEPAWTGWVTDTHCGAKGDNANHSACAKKCAEGGAKWALYDPASKKVYILDAAAATVAEHAGHYVKVTGSLSGETIKVKSIEVTPEPKAGTAKSKS